MSEDDRVAAREFFDDLAPHYAPIHGSAEKLIDRHLSLLTRYARFRPWHTVLDIGCGPGFHLRRLSRRIERGVGIDLSPSMVEVARRRAAPDPACSGGRLTFRVGDGSTLEGIEDQSIDRIISIGSLAHIPEKPHLFRSAARVLRPGGRIVCLTSNGDYLWHTAVGPILGRNTRHLSGDRFVRRRDLPRYVAASGLTLIAADYWRFVPEGDMPPAVALIMRCLDVVGMTGGRRYFWGGLLFCLRK